jgi:hypothetical protein
MISGIQNLKFKMKNGATPEVVQLYELSESILLVVTTPKLILNFSFLILNY